MAAQVASGKTVTYRAAAHAVSDGWCVTAPTEAAMGSNAMPAAAQATHRSPARSSPVERRNRTTSEQAAATRARSTRIAAAPSVTWGNDASGWMVRGLATWSYGGSNVRPLVSLENSQTGLATARAQ